MCLVPSLPRRLDWDASVRAALKIQARPHRCYVNAWQALVDLDWLKEGWLVEGWMVIEGEQVVIVEHGWIEIDRETHVRVIDPTILFLLTPTSPLFFAGVRHCQEQAKALEGAYFPQVRFSGANGPDGLLHPAYAQALHAAHASATSRAIAAGKALLIQPVRLYRD